MPEMKYIHSPVILVALCYVSGSIIWCFWVGMKEIIGRPVHFGKSSCASYDIQVWCVVIF